MDALLVHHLLSSFSRFAGASERGVKLAQTAQSQRALERDYMP
jgi:hypothetical protein